MKKWEREVRHMVQALGLHIDSFTQTGGDHYKLLLRHNDGRTMHLIAAQSPSDYKAALNMRARIRRHFGLGTRDDEQAKRKGGAVVRDRDLPRQ